MFKTANCIKLLQILSCGRTLQSDYLAQRLKINKRNITEYVTELKIAGYDIESIPGKLGGYRLKDKTGIPPLKFTEEERAALRLAESYLQDKDDFEMKQGFHSALSKLDI